MKTQAKFFARQFALAAVVTLTAAAGFAEGIYTTANVNLREGPSSGHHVLDVVPKCTRIQGVDVTRDAYGKITWVKTHLDHHWGWLSARYLSNSNAHCQPARGYDHVAPRQTHAPAKTNHYQSKNRY